MISRVLGRSMGALGARRAAVQGRGCLTRTYRASFCSASTEESASGDESEAKIPKPPYHSKVFLKFDAQDRVLIYNLPRFTPALGFHLLTAAILGLSYLIYRFFRKNAYIKGGICLMLVMGCSAAFVPLYIHISRIMRKIWLVKGGKSICFQSSLSLRSGKMQIKDIEPSLQGAIMKMATESKESLVLETEYDTKMVYLDKKYKPFVLEEELLRAALSGREITYDSSDGDVITLN